jgi:hypothetical protein
VFASKDLSPKAAKRRRRWYPHPSLVRSIFVEDLGASRSLETWLGGRGGTVIHVDIVVEAVRNYAPSLDAAKALF